MKRFFRRAAIWLARLAVVFIVLLVIFYAEEDWRGARDWAACQRDLAAKGESLDLRQLAPPGKPEDDLSKVPIFAELYQQNEEYRNKKKSLIEPRINRLDIEFRWALVPPYDGPPPMQSYLRSAPLNLLAWQKYYHKISGTKLPAIESSPAKDVLQALKVYDPELDEIDKAMANPNAFWPVNYDKPWEITLGGITSTLSVAKVLQLRAAAHLENNEADLAEKDYLNSLNLSRSLSQNCLMVSYLVLCGVRAIDDSILWEGMRLHSWNADQLREMESALAPNDLLVIAAKTLRTERSNSLHMMSLLKAWEPGTKVDVGEYNLDMWYLFHLRPAGWWDQDCRASTYLVQTHIDAINSKDGTFAKTSMVDSHDSLLDLIYLPITCSLGSAYTNIGCKVARAETYNRLARLACRLEEYRIAHGQYPEKLDDLPDLPAHLNQEVLSEQPLRYQRKGEGYLLDSVGWDQKDDGGVISTDEKEGDWVWPSP